MSSASEVERHQPSANRRNQPFDTAEIRVSSSAPNVNISNGKGSKDNNSTLATHVRRNQPSATARYTSTSSTTPSVNISNSKSSKDSSSILVNPIGRNQPSAMSIPTSISSRHAKSMAPNINIGNNKSSKNSSNASKKQGKSID